MRHFPSLKLGDTIQLIAPSRWADEQLIQEAEELINEWGYSASRAENLGARWGQLGGTDEQRAQDFIAAWENQDVKAVWALRGGYGAQRILERVEQHVSGLGKAYIGFSDSTAIHGLLQAKGYNSIHAAMHSTVAETEVNDMAALKSLLLRGPEDLLFESLDADVAGEAEGRLIGGNLSILQTMVGTPSFEVRKGDILFIEDLDEMLYHLDRMLLHLERASILNMLGGILVGAMSDMRDNTIACGFSQDNPFGQSTREVLKQRLAGLGIPIAMGFPAGHGVRNYPLVMGANVRVKVSSASNSLEYIS